MFRDLASLARLPNLPTVWCNVATGYFLAVKLSAKALAGTSVAPRFDAATLMLLMVSATLLYLHGTFLNDAVDWEFDRRHRPERPIPGGRISRDVVTNLALLFGLGALVAAIPLGRLALSFAAGILVCVLLYTWLHKAFAPAILFMALCRGLLIGLGAVGALKWWGPELIPTGLWILSAMALVFCYTLGISLAARGESAGGGGGRWVMIGSRMLLSLPFFVPMGLVLWATAINTELPVGQAALVAGLVGTLGLAWVWFAVAGARISIGTMVGRALPGLALVDFVPLLLIIPDDPKLSFIPISAFLLALVLRKVAPAT